MITDAAATRIMELLDELRDYVTNAQAMGSLTDKPADGSATSSSDSASRAAAEAAAKATDQAASAEQSATLWPAAKPTDASRFFTDHGKFYDFLRGNKLLGPAIDQKEFDGCEAIIIAFGSAGAPVSYCAYGLATAYLETANTMQPVAEANWLSLSARHAYFKRMYDIQGQRPSKARELGNLSPGDGIRYHGRGYVQLTGKANYEKATNKLRAMQYDVDLVANPDLAMRPDIAAIIMVRGMMEGWFTGRELSDDLPEQGAASFEQFRASRDIINGRDRQDDVARFAIDFQTGLLQAGYHV